MNLLAPEHTATFVVARKAQARWSIFQLKVDTLAFVLRNKPQCNTNERRMYTNVYVLFASPMVEWKLYGEKQLSRKFRGNMKPEYLV